MAHLAVTSPSPPGCVVTAVATLDAVLWRERGLLEALLSALESERYVPPSGRVRWLARTTSEVQRLTDAIREIEVLRAMEADAVADQVGLAPAPPLSALAGAVDSGWGAVLLEHADAFRTLAGSQRAIVATVSPSLTAFLR